MAQQGKTKKPKTFHYRAVEGIGDDRNLEDLLRHILFQSHRMVGSRWEDLTPNDKETTLRRFVNRRRDNGSMLFGELVLYEAGRNREVLTLAQDEEELPTEQASVEEDTEGQPREFLEAKLFFGVHENHLIMVQSQSLTGRELENHLRWLVGEHAQALEDGETIILKQGISPQGSKALQRAKTVRVGSPVFGLEGDPKAGSHAEVTQTKVTDQVVGYELLRTVLGEKVAEKIGLEQYQEADDLRVDMFIRRVGHVSYEEDDPGRQAMEAITKTLRHQHPEDLEVVSNKNGKLKGEDLHLSRSISVIHWNGVPEMEDIFHRMQDWLTECLESGVVVPE